jgi:hypothetical protein
MIVLLFAALGPVVGPSHGAFTAVALATAACAAASELHPAADADDIAVNGATTSALRMLNATRRFLK